MERLWFLTYVGSSCESLPDRNVSNPKTGEKNGSKIQVCAAGLGVEIGLSTTFQHQENIDLREELCI